MYNSEMKPNARAGPIAARSSAKARHKTNPIKNPIKPAKGKESATSFKIFSALKI